MIILVRVDSSAKSGTGHLMRCVTLADALKEHGHDVHFVCRDLKGNINQLVAERGHTLHSLPEPEAEFISQSGDTTHASWLEVRWQRDFQETSEILQGVPGQVEWAIVDNYALDYKWETLLRRYVKKIMVIDDLADRKHDCDLLLDQNYYSDLNSRYAELVPITSRMFLGPKYAILRPEFLQERQNLPLRNNTVRRILIFFGGVDQSNETGKALNAIEMLKGSDLEVDVVIGASNPNRSKILEQSRALSNVICHDRVEDMARFMGKADLAIGAGGTTTWERCCLGLPSLIEILSENQTPVAEGIETAKAGINCGFYKDVTPELLAENLHVLLESEKEIVDYSKAAFDLVDGKGVHRIVHAMQSCNIKLRKAQDSDCKLLWNWANDKEVRRFSFNSDPIPIEDHTRWFSNRQKDPESHIFIAEDEQEASIGQIRFDIHNHDTEISYSVSKHHRGSGYGETIVRKGIQKIMDQAEHPVVFYAKVKIENIASQKIFKNIGFVISKEHNDAIKYKLDEIMFH